MMYVTLLFSTQPLFIRSFRRHASCDNILTFIMQLNTCELLSDRACRIAIVLISLGSPWIVLALEVRIPFHSFLSDP
jgi:hypothetical protein